MCLNDSLASFSVEDLASGCDLSRLLVATITSELGCGIHLEGFEGWSQEVVPQAFELLRVDRWLAK